MHRLAIAIGLLVAACDAYSFSEFGGHLLQGGPIKLATPPSFIYDNTIKCAVNGHPSICHIAGNIIEPNVFPAKFSAKSSASESFKIKRPNEYRNADIAANEDAWLPHSDVLEGAEVAKQLEELVNSQKPYSCYEGYCQQILKIASNEHIVYATCSVVSIDEILGPPMQCSGLMVEADGQKWLKATINYRFEYLLHPAPHPQAINIKAAEVGLNPEALIKLASEAMSKPPFQFQKILIRNKDRLLAVATPRASKILIGWYEWPSVSVSAWGEGLDVDCDLQINKYNTTNNRDWHQPSADQQEKYCTALVVNISQAVESLCNKIGYLRKLGTNAIQCSIQKPIPFELVR